MGITAELRWTAAKLINIGKFAVDSAISEVYAVVNGKSKGEAPLEKKNLVVVVEEMQAKLEKLQQDKTSIEQQQQQSETSSVTAQEKERLNKHLFNEPLRMPKENKRVFIRSRM